MAETNEELLDRMATAEGAEWFDLRAAVLARMARGRTRSRYPKLSGNRCGKNRNNPKTGNRLYKNGGNDD